MSKEDLEIDDDFIAEDAEEIEEELWDKGVCNYSLRYAC